MPSTRTITPTSCVIYVRVSFSEQILGTSLATQEQSCREYAARMGWEVLCVFVERGESAKTVDREEFNKAIAFCSNKKNSVGYFLVYKVDRFSRRAEDHLAVRAILRKTGTELRSVTEPIDESSTGKLMETVIAGFAEFDNNVRTERTKGGMIARVREGIWCWPTPIGYHKLKTGKGTNISPDPEKAPFVQLAFTEYVKGSYTYRGLAEMLAEKGLRTKFGAHPSFQSVEKMLHNPVYCGRIDVFNESNKSSFEPLISEALFNACQNITNGVTSPILPRSANNPDYPLRHFARCSACHEPLTGSHSTGRHGKKYPYYHHNAGSKCRLFGSIPKDTFEQSFVEFLDSLTPKSEYLNLFKAVVMDIWQSNYRHYDGANAKVNVEIEKLEQERQHVFDLHRSGKYSDAEFEEQKKIVNSRIAQKRSELQVEWSEEIHMEAALSHCLQFVTNAAKAWLTAEYEIRLQMQGSTCPSGIEFDGKNCRTADLSLIYELQKTPCEESSVLVAPRGIEPLLTA